MPAPDVHRRTQSAGPCEPADISVIIPTCDRPHYLQNAVASVLAQTLPPREILVVDNGLQPVDARTLPSAVTIVRLPARVGPSRARNHGASVANGDYLAFLDDDDWWDAGFLEHARHAISGDARCVYGQKFTYEDGVTRPYKLAQQAQLQLSTLLQLNPGTGGMNLLIDRGLFFRIGGFDESLLISEDRALALEVLRSGNRIEIAADAIAIVRHHGTARLREHHLRKLRFVWKYLRLYSPVMLAKTVAKIFAASLLCRTRRLWDAAWPLPGAHRDRGRLVCHAAPAFLVVALLSLFAASEAKRDHGLSPFIHDQASDGRRKLIDFRGAVFQVANSATDFPTRARPCWKQKRGTNPYPIQIMRDDHVAILGGLVLGRVPQTSDWRDTYCNSAAVILKGASGAELNGMRIAGAWDGVRASQGSPNLVIRNVWMSDIRDDAFENDYLLPARVENSLLDGVFTAVSMKSGKGFGRRSGSQVAVSDSLVRLKEYPYKGERKYGSLSKNSENSPGLQLKNSVVAVDFAGGSTWNAYWQHTWSTLSPRSSGNTFLWLSDLPIPQSFPMPPASFQVRTGQAARQTWARAKLDWINCHPALDRRKADPVSRPVDCPHRG